MKSKIHLTKQVSLKGTQSLLWRLITAPESLDKAVPKSQVALLPIVSKGALSSIDRLNVYGNMYFFRILEALQGDFPAVFAFLKPDLFHNLITDYLIKHPSTHFSLRYVGQHLPHFIQKHPLGKKHAFLSDLAKYEWSLLEVFDAPDSQSMKLDDLRQIPPDLWDKIQLQLIPAHSLVSVQYDVPKLRQHILAQKKPVLEPSQKGHLIVWRREFEILQRTLNPLEAQILKKLATKCSFGSLCEWVAQRRGAEKAPLIMARFIQSWLRDGFLAQEAHDTQRQ